MRALKVGLATLSRVAPDSAAAVAERLFLTPRRHKRPFSEREVLSRARRMSLAVHGEGGPLAAWEWGSEGPRVLLVHGWEGRGAQLGTIGAALVTAGYRVITFDAPAHGDSPGKQASLFQFADAVEQAVEAFGPFHAIVTHSMGGAATMWANRHRPLAERLVLIAPPMDIREFTRQGGKALGISEDIQQRVNQRLAARFRVPLEHVHAERLASAMSGPLLVIHDEGDKEIPIVCSETIVRVWPGAQLVRTRGLGHMRVLRDRGVVDRITHFVSQKSS